MSPCLTLTEELTQQGDVFALPLPKGRAEIVYFDEGKAKDKAHGLGLRIREGGSRKWVYFLSVEWQAAKADYR